MPRIDIDEVLREKAPRFAKYIPRFIRNWLRRTIHEEALNDILAAGWNRPPQEFIHVAFERMRIAYRIDGLERLDPAERYLGVANHPFGGLDGMMIADRADRAVRRCARGGQRPADARRTAATDLASGQQARTADGRIRPPLRRSLRRRPADPDLSGRTLLAAARRRGERHAVAAQLHQARPRFGAQDRTALRRRPAVRTFFYRIARLRERLGIKLNVEMLWLPDEMFRQGGSRFRIVAGDPITPDGLRGTLRQQADTVRGEVYRLKEKLPCTK